MVTNTHQIVLEGMEGMLTDLREVVCDCGCGETFYQRRVGRVRKYMNAQHKRRAEAARKAEAAQDFTAWLIGVLAVKDTEWSQDWMEGLSDEARSVLVMLGTEDSALVEGLRQLERIMREG